MRRTLASVLSAWLVVGSASLAAAQSADGWNDARARSLVELATRRRAEQLADTGLVDYRANARGYVSFLVSMGSGFLEAPKIVKTDQLALEVYWHAPNESKQRIIGRRDTLLFPTDIQYHRDHLGIVQNNFPDFIRIGEGDEVSDVPHPLSSLGLSLYDFRVSGDSIRMRLPDRTIDLIEVKVRPKNDREPRIIGAIYIDPTGGQVVRMAFNFTQAAFLDKDLEDLAIVLENRLVGGRFWLPSHQTIEIRRTGTYLDFPVRGIIRGGWEVGNYELNTSVPAAVFAPGPEIVSAPTQELKKYQWQGTIMDSLPPDLRATVDPDIKGVLDEARGLVREQALQRVQTLRMAAPKVSDFARYNRVEGLALGGGINAHLVSNLSLQARGRYGVDDQAGMGGVQLRVQRPSEARFELYASRDFVDVGDEQERSTLVNSIAAQEFGSDFTDPYRVDAIGGRLAFELGSAELTFFGARERHRQLASHATSFTGRPTPPPLVADLDGWRSAVSYFRPFAPIVGPGAVELRATLSGITHEQLTAPGGAELLSGRPTGRASLVADYRVDIGSSALVIREIAAGVAGPRPLPREELVYLGGPWTAPGYAYHLLIAEAASSTRLEFQTPVPFIPVPLGRFGRMPGQARLAPFVSGAFLHHQLPVSGYNIVNGPCGSLFVGGPCSLGGAYYSVGVGLLTFFDGLRFDVARGFRPRGWTFNVDVSREFWSIL